MMDPGLAQRHQACGFLTLEKILTLKAGLEDMHQKFQKRQNIFRDPSELEIVSVPTEKMSGISLHLHDEIPQEVDHPLTGPFVLKELLVLGGNDLVNIKNLQNSPLDYPDGKGFDSEYWPLPNEYNEAVLN